MKFLVKVVRSTNTASTIHNKIKLHCKLKAKLKTCDEEYIDPGTGASAKLSEDDIYEINAIPSFKAYMQNETGPKKACPLDITITELSRADFPRHLTDDYDEDNTDKYNYQKAQESLASNQATELHEAKMKQLASTTANAMTTGGTTDTTSSSGGTSSGGT